MLKAIILCLAFSVNAIHVEGLNCYTCRSIGGVPDDCEEGYDENPSYKQICPEIMAYPKCYVTRTERINGIETMFERGCMEYDCNNRCDFDLEDPMKYKKCTHCCLSNFCNTGNHGNTLNNSGRILGMVVGGVLCLYLLVGTS
ncbi:uncharacterized protein [Ptychodera flava]|uniref:uncharacterized protein n=1 Tax=Ptychodera flava TaxID=63121 RepID=UPI00396A2CAF